MYRIRGSEYRLTASRVTFTIRGVVVRNDQFEISECLFQCAFNGTADDFRAIARGQKY